VSQRAKAFLLGCVFLLGATACAWHWQQTASLVVALRRRGVRAETWTVQMQTGREPGEASSARRKRGPVYRAEFSVDGHTYHVPNERIWYPKADLTYLPEDPSRNMIHYLEDSVFESVPFAGLIFFGVLWLVSWTGALVGWCRARARRKPTS
jgi:hypothetical protein